MIKENSLWRTHKKIILLVTISPVDPRTHVRAMARARKYYKLILAGQKCVGRFIRTGHGVIKDVPLVIADGDTEVLASAHASVKRNGAVGKSNRLLLADPREMALGSSSRMARISAE